MSKMSKAIVALGVVAGLGVAALPLSSYAVDGASVSKSAQVVAEVSGAIAIDITDPSEAAQEANTAAGVTLTGNTLNLGTLTINGAPSVGTMGVRVATNASQGYTLSIKASSATGMIGSGTAEGFTIPPVAAGEDVTQGSASWGYKVGEATKYTGVTTDGEQIRAAGPITGAGATVEEGQQKYEVTDVTFAVAADSTTHDGTYTGTVIFTAIAQD